MIREVIRNLRIEVPDPLQSKRVTSDVPVANANPHIVFPLEDIRYEADDRGAVFVGEVTSVFINQQVLPRGRPHIALLHIALIDDAIATVSYGAITGVMYGIEHRYVELGAVAAFHREAFVRGSVVERQFGTIDVDSYRARWQLLPGKEGKSLMQHGIFQVSILGVRDGEEIPVSSVEGYFLRRDAIRRSN